MFAGHFRRDEKILHKAAKLAVTQMRREGLTARLKRRKPHSTACRLEQTGHAPARNDATCFGLKGKLPTMRSDLIFGALTHVNNRYKLCQLASKATRKLHKPNTRLQDTTNEVLERFKDTVPMNTATDVETESLTERRAA